MTTLLQISCPTCTTANRVPENRLKDSPVCGKCRSPLFSGQPVILTMPAASNFPQPDGYSCGYRLLPPWRSPCKAMAPAFNMIAAGLEPLIRLAKLDTLAHQQIAAQYNIRSIPTLIVFRNENRALADVWYPAGSPEACRAYAFEHKIL